MDKKPSGDSIVRTPWALLHVGVGRDILDELDRVLMCEESLEDEALASDKHRKLQKGVFPYDVGDRS